MGTATDRRFVVARPQGLSHKVRAALRQFLEAYEYAWDVGRDAWDFAVEIGRLRAAGLTKSDFRWLVCKGYVEHAHEIRAFGEEGRAFRLGGSLIFTKRTCFVLTEAGVSLARTVRAEAPLSADSAAGAASQSVNGQAEPLAPLWDGDFRELRVGDRLIKRYKVPAPNQTTILSAFQEEGWPPRIDDPLAPQPECDPKRRLNDTIKSLNRHHCTRAIRFVGDGTGTGVCWEILRTDSSGDLR